MATTVDEVWKSMSVKKFSKVCFKIVLAVIIALLIYLVVARPVSKTVKINNLTASWPQSRALKFVVSSPFVTDNGNGEWSAFSVDKKRLDFKSDTDFWTIKDHDGVLFSVNNYRYDFCKSQIVTCEYGILPSKLSVDNFKAIGISECELPSDVEIYDHDSVISPSQNDTVMLKITPDEMAKTLDILSSTSDEKRDNYYCVDEFSPVKLFNIRLFMSESDNLFFSTYAKLAFDGEQWKITLSKAWENEKCYYYVADVPFDTLMLSACEY